MAPSPENDTGAAPKAPDKDSAASVSLKDKDKDSETVYNMNEMELKALLNEAITYKNPKDREGKSDLFKNLLSEAEEKEKKARATSAGGSELVRYCNPSAKKHGRNRRKPSSISENLMHGGSLDNLNKEELYEQDRHLHRTRKSVSARQREGGSLPCNVNSSVQPKRDYQFLEEVRRKKEMKDKDYTIIDMESESLLDHDSLAENYQQEAISAKFKSEATILIKNDVQDVEHFYQADLISPRIKVPHGNLVYSNAKVEDKKVDENGNHHVGKIKKKKEDKNVIVLKSDDIVGHRSDIIDNLQKLVEYIGGDSLNSESKAKSNLHKSKQLHKSESGGRKKRSKTKDRNEMKKSNSLGEISVANLDDFSFNQGDEEKVVLRSGKVSNADKPRERRSWGNVEPPPFECLYSNASVENLESENWVESKTKKKNKKRRNSVNSSSRRQNNSDSGLRQRRSSPEFRGKATCSVPHSEKSNDSSDADSVHSLPIDANSQGSASYADIARNSERACLGGIRKVSPEKEEKGVAPSLSSNVVPDVYSTKSFPTISSRVGVEDAVGSLPAKSACGRVKNGAPGGRNNTKEVEFRNDIQNDLSIIEANEKEAIRCNAHKLPANIPDVQTIEKLQLMGQQKQQQANSVVANDCDSSEKRTTNTAANHEPPAVVILSGSGNEVPGLVFGFDVNEQLLSEDICDNFIAKYVAPEVFTSVSHNHDKIVSYIGETWEAIVNGGAVQYYSDGL